jgi:RHS repeat-associated protein
MGAGLLVALPSAAAAAPWRPPVPKDVVTVPVRPVQPAAARTFWTPEGREVRGTPTVTWPRIDTASVQRLARLSGAGAVGRSIRVLDRAATRQSGVDGVVLELSSAATSGPRAAGAADVTVDYRAFADAYGGDWASRLRMVALSGACTAKGGACVATPLPSRNDVQAGTVTAAVPAGVTTVAMAAGPSGDNGSYKATSLSAASTWQVSRQSGDFSWSYAVPVPPATGGPVPELSLSYSAGSVDGMTSMTNTQGSWIGDGWEMWPGFVERKYRSCNDDKDPVGGANPNNKSLTNGEQCWYADNATLSFNGSATELVRGGDGLWRGTSDSGSKVELLKDGALANGDNDNEYWKVTTTDGTQYFFGRHRRPGWTSGDETNSVWTAPVYGNHHVDPCYNASFAASRCTQAWRWNLDYVVDPHGNTLTYFYAREIGAYGREADPNKRTEYHRGGWLTRIDYGTRGGTELTTPAPNRVLFDVADRCAPNTTCSPTVPASWPDTPWDQYCAATPCTDKIAPTFWTQKRLAKIRTEVRVGSTYTPVDSLTLRHEYLNAGEREGKPMWLRGLTSTGHVGGDVSLPETTFDPGADPLPNRVDGPADGRTALNRWRMKTITTESGSQVSITYSGHDCTKTSLPTPHTNTKRCMPTWWAPDGLEPTLDWFHKYVVTRIDVWDLTGASGHEQSNYDYLDAPAWHYDDGELTPTKERTWNDWRGYSKVRVRSGLDPGPQSAKEYLYFRGMDGDRLQPSGGTRSVSITDSQGTTLPDHRALSGQMREEIVYNGLGGAVLTGSLFDYWKRGPLATRGPVEAYMVNPSVTRTRAIKSDGSFQWTRTETTYNNDGLTATVDDLGDEAATTDDQCTRTEYARNADIWMLDRVKRVETVAVRCSATPNRPADVLADARTYYDDPDVHGAAPTRGLVVREEELDSWTGSTPNYVTVARRTYDAHGRVRTSADALGRTSTITYTPETGGPVTRVVAANALGHTSTTEQDPTRGLPRYSIDDDGARTDFAYDALGRTTKVWVPGRDRALSPSYEFAYDVRNTAPTYVTTRELLPTGTTYRTSVSLYDGQMRARQSQIQATGGGRIVSDTVYDSRGRVAWESGNYFNDGAPSGTLVTSTGQVQIPAVTVNEYDGADRLVRQIFRANGVDRWRTTTTYFADRIQATPPAGATPTTKLVDARGRMVELREHRGADTASPFDATRYAYTRRDELASVTDAAGNVWRYQYDVRGRQIRNEDPDQGVSTMTYDVAGQQLSSTGADGITLASTYDALGRQTSLREGSATGPKRAEWIYDALPNGIGKLSSSIRYLPGGQVYRTDVTGYDQVGRPLGSKLTVPAADGFGQTEFVAATTYKPDGSVATQTLPRVGDLAEEKLTFNYDDVGQPTTFLSPLGIYVYSVTRNKLGVLTQRVVGHFGRRTAMTYTVDEPTGRMTEAVTTPETKPEAAHYGYTYDDAGNVTRVSDAPAGSGVTDVQCYRYDHLARLSTAWTPAGGNCATNPSATSLGGPAPYYRSWSYDVTGNRLSETVHTAGGATTRDYTYPAAGASQPHAVRSLSTGETFSYDANGQMVARTKPGGPNQTLTWDAEGHLASVTEGTKTTSFVYDADGERLIRRDSAGTTLYLPDGSELFKPAGGGAAVGTRYYAHNGVTIAVRKAGSLTWIVGDHHNTAETQITDTGQTVTRRRTLPFGEIRGPEPSWVGERGFVDGTRDSTGLTHLGAREYDPTLGRFISVDPVIDTGDPQTMNGYAYANNSPTSHSDPDGRCYGREEGDLCPGHTRGPWAGTPAGDVARDRHFAGDRARAAARSAWTTSQYYQYDANAQAAEWRRYEEAKRKQEAEQAARKAKKCSGFWRCAGKWVSDHKAQIAGFAAGLVVGAACTALTGGGGVVLCGALAGAVAGGITGAMEGKRGWDLVGSVVVGAAAGAVGGAVAAYAGPLISGGIASAARGAVTAGHAVARGASAAGQTAATAAAAVGRSAVAAGRSAASAASRGAAAVGRGARSAAQLPGRASRALDDFAYSRPRLTAALNKASAWGNHGARIGGKLDKLAMMRYSWWSPGMGKLAGGAAGAIAGFIKGYKSGV